MTIDYGCILLARKIQSSEIWKKPADWLKIWVYLLQEVNHQDNKLFKRGENLFNYKDVARECGVKYNSVAKFIKWAKLATLVATHKTTRGVVVKVLNYNKYQTLQNYKSDTKGDTVGEIEAKQKRNRSDTITKECKNENTTTAKTVLKILNLSGKENLIPAVEDLLERYTDKVVRDVASKVATKSVANPDARWTTFVNWCGSEKAKSTTNADIATMTKEEKLAYKKEKYNKL